MECWELQDGDARIEPVCYPIIEIRSFADSEHCIMHGGQGNSSAPSRKTENLQLIILALQLQLHSPALTVARVYKQRGLPRIRARRVFERDSSALDRI